MAPLYFMLGGVAAAGIFILVFIIWYDLRLEARTRPASGRR